MFEVISEYYNYEPSAPKAYPIYRKRTKGHRDTLQSLTRNAAIGNRDLTAVLHSQFPGSHFTTSDIKNERNAIRAATLEGYSPTQALIRILEESNVKHSVKYHDSDVSGIIWTYP